MEEFRPADVIDEDTRLAESLVDGDLDALGALVDRYGRAVGTAVAASPDATSLSTEVFVRAWRDRQNIEPGDDFAPWLGAIAAAVAGRPVVDIGDSWTVAMAVDALDPAGRAMLRAHHIDGEELPDGADRHELRLRRRLSHLGGDAAVLQALADPRPWAELHDDLMQQVRSQLGVDDAVARSASAQADDLRNDAAAAESPGRVARSLRPVLLGLAGAVTVLFVAIVALSAASGSPDSIAFTADLTPTGAISDVDGGELTVTVRDRGLQLDLDAPTLPRRAGNQYYEGILILQDGTELPVGTFNEGFSVTLSGGVSLDRVEEFLVVARGLGSDDADVILKLDVPRT